jgi:hypothetical protein
MFVVSVDERLDQLRSESEGGHNPHRRAESDGTITLRVVDDDKL